MMKLIVFGSFMFCAHSAYAQGAASKDSAKDTANADSKVDSSTVTIQREVFTYNAEGRRDPFVSLLSTSELRPHGT
jgi:hypothetical protein